MLRPLSGRFECLRWLAMLALAVQLAAVATVPWQGMRLAALDQLVAVSICHADAAGPGQRHAPTHRHAPLCLLCPFCQAMTHAGPLLVPLAPVLTPPAPALLRLAMPPPARAPPARPPGAAYPRGPPALV